MSNNCLKPRCVHLLGKRKKGSVWISQELYVPCQRATRYWAKHWVLSFIQAGNILALPAWHQCPTTYWLCLYQLNFGLWPIIFWSFSLMLGSQGWSLLFQKYRLLSPVVKSLPLNSIRSIKHVSIRRLRTGLRTMGKEKVLRERESPLL